MKRSDMPLLDTFRYMEELPGGLGLRLYTMSEHDLSGWIACFQFVKPDKENTEKWKQWISIPEELDRGARALQKAAMGLIAALMVDNDTNNDSSPLLVDEYLPQGTWAVGGRADLVPGPPALMEVNPTKDLIPVWDLALIQALRATGEEGQKHAESMLEAAIEHGEALYKHCSEHDYCKTNYEEYECDPWSWFRTPIGAPRTGPTTFRIRKSFQHDSQDSYATKEVHMSGIREALCAPAWRRLAWAVWMDLIKEDWEKRSGRASRKAIAPAVTGKHYFQTIAPLEKTRRISGSVEKGIWLIGTDKQIPLFSPEAPALTDVAVEALRKLASNETWLPAIMERLVIHITRKCWQAFHDGNVDARILVYSGGWIKLCLEAGIKSKNHADHVPGIFAAMKAWKGNDGKQPAMIADYWVRKAAPGREAEIRINVGEGLVPGYAATQPTGDDRRLLPVLDVPSLVIPGIGSDHTGSILNYRWELLLKLREAVCSEIGGIGKQNQILLSRVARTDAAMRAGLTEEQGTAIDKVWIGDQDAAWLQPCGPEHVIIKDDDATSLFRNAFEQSQGRRNAAMKQRRVKNVKKV